MFLQEAPEPGTNPEVDALSSLLYDEMVCVPSAMLFIYHAAVI